MQQVIALSDHLIFNSAAQKNRFLPMINAAPSAPDIGLRINPLHSEADVEKYDPCAPCSRLGIPITALSKHDLIGVSGLHLHTLCEQGFEPLERTWNAIQSALEPFLPQLKWINFGGGHHITRADYNRSALVQFIKRIREQYSINVYLEPGEAVALNAGILVGEILDTAYNDMHLAITDVSATCHMPDVIEAPYRPDLMHEAHNTGTLYRLGGPSCLAGDIIGDYRFGESPAVGQRIAFLDQAHYSLVKTNTFNGVPLPAIALWNSNTDKLQMIREFGYHDFLTRLHA
jgi:carboxynorspermidine decarboxylase